MALAAYRQVLRSARIAFQDDARVLTAACAEARSKFDSLRHLPPDASGTEQKIAEAQEVARLLRQNVVQGEPIAGQGEKYHIELGLARSNTISDVQDALPEDQDNTSVYSANSLVPPMDTSHEDPILDKPKSPYTTTSTMTCKREGLFSKTSTFYDDKSEGQSASIISSTRIYPNHGASKSTPTLQTTFAETEG
ncbi:MAG: hypothetical protein Q9164_006332 [Protoblastenia rupestris]